VIEAPYGHDCFLLEEARQTPTIRQFLGRHSLAEGGAGGSYGMTSRKRPL